MPVEVSGDLRHEDHSLYLDKGILSPPVSMGVLITKDFLLPAWIRFRVVFEDLDVSLIEGVDLKLVLIGDWESSNIMVIFSSLVPLYDSMG